MARTLTRAASQMRTVTPGQKLVFERPLPEIRLGLRGLLLHLCFWSRFGLLVVETLCNKSSSTCKEGLELKTQAWQTVYAQ